MPRIVVILPTSTYRAKDFIDAGAELGVDLIVASEGDLPIDMGDRFLRIDCGDPDLAARAIVEAGDRLPIDGIVAADDRGVITAAIAATKLGLPANDPDAAAATRDKIALRERLGRAEAPQPAWRAVGPDDDHHAMAAELGYPVVLKPRSLAAGQGVIEVEDASSLDAGVRRVREIASAEGVDSATILMERFVPGAEVAVEGLVVRGSLLPLAIFDKPVTPAGEGFQETILVTPSRLGDESQSEVLRVAEQAVRSIGLSTGPVHIELMVGAGTVSIIEVAARSIGGLCSRSLDFGLMDTSLEALILRNAIGRDKPEMRRSGAASGVLMIPIPGAGELIAVDGIAEVRAIEGVTGVDITMHPGEQIAPPPEGGRYLGFVFARGETPEDVEASLRDAMDTIGVVVA